MSSKERQKKRQADREAKMQKQMKSGKVARVYYQEKKKKAALPNRLNIENSPEQERAKKQSLAEDATKVYRKLLPRLLTKLSHIRDPRRIGSVKHKHTVLLLYGILMFVQQVGSRREANRSLDRIQFENMKAMFPELETLPHADTLARFLEVIEVSEIQKCMIELVNDLIRRKKFRRYLLKKNYLIAIDGTQKLCRDYQLEKEYLERHVGTEKKAQYYIYVLESVLVLDNGVTLPLMSEFLKNDSDWDGDSKQDCERKAFIRLANRLKKVFPKLRITLLMDGLYACGSVLKTCREYGWGYMITLKEGSLPDVWHEAIGLMDLSPEDSQHTKWGDREQWYAWANDIEYEFEDRERRRHKEMLHVAYCLESWTENHNRSTGIVEKKETRYCWLSAEPLTGKNIFERCTRMGRYRWRIENNILTEKHQGYDYEHTYSFTWNAMEGYHYLMKIGRFLNVIAASSELLIERVKVLGIRGFIERLRNVLSSVLLDREAIRQAAECHYQLRIV